MTRIPLRVQLFWGTGSQKHGLEQCAAGRAKEQPALFEVGEVHRRVADAELIELVAKLRIALHSEANVIDGFRCTITAVPLRADDVDERMAFRVEPVAGNTALYGER